LWISYLVMNGIVHIRYPEGRSFIEEVVTVLTSVRLFYTVGSNWIWKLKKSFKIRCLK
jgi:hypothetical protein